MTRQKIGAVIGALLLFGGLVAGVSMGAFAQDDGQNVDDNSGVEVPPPSGNADDPYDCGDFENRAQVEAVFNASNDVSGLDGDDDGIACEDIEVSGPTNETTEDTPTNETTTDEPTNETSTEDTPTDTPTEESTEEQPPANDTEEMKDDEMQDTPKDDEATETPVDDDEAPDEPQDDAEDEQHDDEMTDEKDDTADEQKADTTDEKTDEEPPC